MAYQIPLGGKMESPNINRSNVAEGFPGRAVLLGENCVFAKAQAYDDRIKRSIEVDQEAILKYRFDKVLTYYYILIARLNTDNRGNVVSDDVVIEYLRLSEKQWDDLTISMNEMGSFTSLLLTKVKKTGDDGRDFSYVEVKLSNYKEIPAAVSAKVEQMVQTENFVNSIWGMVDAATTITVEVLYSLLTDICKPNSFMVWRVCLFRFPSIHIPSSACPGREKRKQTAISINLIFIPSILVLFSNQPQLLGTRTRLEPLRNLFLLVRTRMLAEFQDGKGHSIHPYRIYRQFNRMRY